MSHRFCQVIAWRGAHISRCHFQSVYILNWAQISRSGHSSNGNMDSFLPRSQGQNHARKNTHWPSNQKFRIATTYVHLGELWSPYLTTIEKSLYQRNNRRWWYWRTLHPRISLQMFSGHCWHHSIELLVADSVHFSEPDERRLDP